MKERTKRNWLTFLAIAPPIMMLAGFAIAYGPLIGQIIMSLIVPGYLEMENALVTANSAGTLAQLFLGFGSLVLGMILSLVAIVLYIIMACKNPNLDGTRKLLWGLGIYSAHVFVIPIYWWMYIKKR